MLLSITNIAWEPAEDGHMIDFLCKQQFDGLEVAPTRVFHENPYGNDKRPDAFLRSLRQLKVASVQAILYGRMENIFRSPLERTAVSTHTKKAIGFAAALSAGNVVFGCPKNRDGYSPRHHDTAVSFFRELGEYALRHRTVLSIEPNPAIYGTNFINTTRQAFDFALEINSPGFMVNVDLGTMLHNKEDLSLVEEQIDLVNHIHISEPNLDTIEKRAVHGDLAAMLRLKGYGKFVSIEARAYNDVGRLKETAAYIYDTFKGDGGNKKL